MAHGFRYFLERLHLRCKRTNGSHRRPPYFWYLKECLGEVTRGGGKIAQLNTSKNKTNIRKIRTKLCTNLTYGFILLSHMLKAILAILPLQSLLYPPLCNAVTPGTPAVHRSSTPWKQGEPPPPLHWNRVRSWTSLFHRLDRCRTKQQQIEKSATR